MIAAFNHNIKIVELLLQFGANSNAIDSSTNSNAMLCAFNVLVEWSFETKKSSCAQIASLLIKAGFLGTHKAILSMLKIRRCEQTICDFFTSVWKKHYSKDIENFYTRGAIAGALVANFQSDLGRHVGIFLDQKDGANVAKTCKAAVAAANYEKCEQILILKNLFTNTLAEDKNISDELNKVTEKLPANLR